jgi:hypothetical protein
LFYEDTVIFIAAVTGGAEAGDMAHVHEPLGKLVRGAPVTHVKLLRVAGALCFP